ncbi:recombination-associated protein RdgC [Escherichia coli]|uniref:recombination-associated protein RdgC n=1 Tax=Escherichia coli TaxID=562 RepID=UPI00263C74D3|nr:recombination-associated protein RdgC [Escherichia coli]MDN5158179.1 recombination-associated protein RdgC [Escherichia coli]
MPNHDRFECQTAIDSDAILQMILFTPCGSQDMAKFGFVSPFGDNSEVIAMHGNGFILVEAKRETKILPPPVIQRAIQEKIEKLDV